MAEVVGVVAGVLSLTRFANKIVRSTRNDFDAAQQLQPLEGITERLKSYENHPSFRQDERVRQSVLDTRIALLALARSIRKLEDNGSRTKKIILKFRRSYFQKDITNAQYKLDILLRQLNSTLSEQLKR